MTTVVAGANGHLGGNLVRELLKRDSVRAVVHRNRQALEGLGVQFVQGDVGDVDSLKKAFEGADTVYHLAAKISIIGDPDGSVRKINVDGARNAAQAALEVGVERMVHVSSVHAFDLRKTHRVTERSERSGPHNYAYDHSKAEGEVAVREVMAEGLDVVIVNPTGVIGPLDFAPSRMGQVFLDLANRRLPAVIGGAFDFVDVRDVVAGMMAARDKGQTGHNYLLGGHRLSVRDVAEMAEEVTGVPAPRWTLPQWMAYPAIPFAARQAKRTGGEPKFTRESLGALRHGPQVDCSRAEAELGYTPRPASETVQDIYDWFEEHAMWQP